ncbi:glycogen synthase GlgA [Mucilaginibacter koreensis]
MRVYHLSAECYPIAKVGGLGDVVGALPKYQNLAGIDAAVVLPHYDRKFVHENEFEVVFRASNRLGDRRLEFEVWKEKTNKLGFELYLIHIPGLLDRPEVYSYPDEREQFIAYQLSFLDWITWSQQTPDLIHCHDHHTGLVPFLLQHSALYRRLSKTPTVFTIHNGQYHGAFGWEKFYYLPEIDPAATGLLDWSGGINPLASAIKCCNHYTAVSPSYLLELAERSNGLEYLFFLERAKGSGIINGIDTEVWDPATDAALAANYDITTVDTQKQKDKDALCERFGLSPELPLISFIGRLVVEKGADLLADAFSDSLTEHAGHLNILVLGTGDKDVEEALKALEPQFPENYKVYIGYNEDLAHLIYAGSDFLLMPSRVEPCGLNQLYALRYGTMPVVHSTGGLKDTVIDFGEDDGYGICFDQNNVTDIVASISRAKVLFENTPHLQLLRKRMMALDFSWDQSARQYIQLYESLTPKI